MQTNFDRKMLGRKRRANGYKQTEVAAMLGVNVSTIKRFEAKGIQPHLEAKRWVLMQKIYGMTVEQFAEIDFQQTSAA